MRIDNGGDPNVQNSVRSGVNLWSKSALKEVTVPFRINTNDCK